MVAFSGEVEFSEKEKNKALELSKERIGQ